MFIFYFNIARDTLEMIHIINTPTTERKKCEFGIQLQVSSKENK